MSFYIPYYGYDPQGGWGGLGNLLQQPQPQNAIPGPSLAQPAQETTPTQVSGQPTQQAQPANAMLSNQIGGEQAPGFSFDNVNWLSPAGSLLSPTLSMGGSLVGGDDLNYSSLAGGGLGALTNILGQAGRTPVFSEMGQQALPALSSVLGGGATPLINSINPVGMMLGAGQNGGNLGGTIGGAAMPAIAGGLNAVGLAPGIADTLGLGTTAAVEGMGGALGGTGAGIGAGLGALGGAGMALSFPAMALGNFLYGLINDLGGGDHPSMAEYQQAAIQNQIMSQSNDILHQLKAGGMTDSQVIDYITKNTNLNYMLGPLPEDPKQMYSGGGVINTTSFGGQPIYPGGTKEGLVLLATPEGRAYLDQIAQGASYGNPMQDTWPTIEGSPYGWNPPKNYLYYSPEGASNLETQFNFGGLAGMTQPPPDYKLPTGVQAVLNDPATWKEYTGSNAPTDLEKQWVINEIGKSTYAGEEMRQSRATGADLPGAYAPTLSQELINMGVTNENQGITPNYVHSLYNDFLTNYPDPNVRDWMAGRDVLWGQQAGPAVAGDTSGKPSQSPTVQSYYDPLVKQYEDLGYDPQSAQWAAYGGIGTISSGFGGLSAAKPYLPATSQSGVYADYLQQLKDSSKGYSFNGIPLGLSGYQVMDPSITPQGYNLMGALSSMPNVPYSSIAYGG
jgi:hypothetical protein